ncbi:unnamed protein product [Arctogadus glacialis]
MEEEAPPRRRSSAMEEEAPPRRSYAHEKLHQGGGGSAHSPSCWSLSSVATTEGRGTAPLVSTGHDPWGQIVYLLRVR